MRWGVTPAASGGALAHLPEPSAGWEQFPTAWGPSNAVWMGSSGWAGEGPSL